MTVSCGRRTASSTSCCPRVSKPNRYLGNALHVPRASRSTQAEVRVLLAFPDAYEIGLSNLGIRIIHHVLNSAPDARGRADVRAVARRRGRDAPPRRSRCSRSTRTRRPARSTCIGFSLQYELQYTNVLMMLDLAGLPLRTRRSRRSATRW